MSIIRFALEKTSNFCYLDPIILNSENRFSPPLSTEDIGREHLDILNKAIDNNEIYLIDKNNKRIPGLIEELTEFNCFEIDYNEEPVNTTDEFEVFSATVELDKEDMCEEVEALPEKEDFESAEFLLSKNGNTVKKSILSLDLDNSSHKLLLIACREIELDNKKRKSVMNAIDLILFK